MLNDFVPKFYMSERSAARKVTTNGQVIFRQYITKEHKPLGIKITNLVS
jgi:hypothetical protein